MNETNGSGMSTAELLEASWRVRRSHARIFVLMGLPVATLLLVLFAAPLAAQLNPLRYNPVAEQYSRSLDRIIMISASPDAVHIYDPLAQTDTTVGLPKTPLCLSVSADGNYAAVGHDSLISYIDLAVPKMRRTWHTWSSNSHLHDCPDSFLRALASYARQLGLA